MTSKTEEEKHEIIKNLYVDLDLSLDYDLIGWLFIHTPLYEFQSRSFSDPCSLEEWMCLNEKYIREQAGAARTKETSKKGKK